MTGARGSGVRVLEVLLYDTVVGTLTLLPGDRSLFVFTREYAEAEDRPVLSLSFKTVEGGVNVSRRPTRTRVPPFFSNLLPEGHLRTYLAQRAGVHPAREFVLLEALGRDLPGAVTVRPAEGDALPAASGARTGNPALEEDQLRFSLAGVQLKFSAILEADGGLTIPAEGVGGSWIVKLPSARYPAVPELEYAMMELARTVGIDVPEVRLVPAERLLNLPSGVTTLGPALAVRRFDREGTSRRIHIEDFAQVFNVFANRKYERASYENLAAVLRAESGMESVIEFARRLAFSALIGNADMHLKNWSVIYRDRRTAALAPAYDLVSTVAYLDDTEMALSFGTERDMLALRPAQFARFAARAGVPSSPVVEAARETAARLREAWDSHPALDVVPTELRTKVGKHMRRVPLP